MPPLPWLTRRAHRNAEGKKKESSSSNRALLDEARSQERLKAKKHHHNQPPTTCREPPITTTTKDELPGIQLIRLRERIRAAQDCLDEVEAIVGEMLLVETAAEMRENSSSSSRQPSSTVPVSLDLHLEGLHNSTKALNDILVKAGASSAGRLDDDDARTGVELGHEQYHHHSRRSYPSPPPPPLSPRRLGSVVRPGADLDMLIYRRDQPPPADDARLLLPLTPELSSSSTDDDSSSSSFCFTHHLDDFETSSLVLSAQLTSHSFPIGPEHAYHPRSPSTISDDMSVAPLNLPNRSSSSSSASVKSSDKDTLRSPEPFEKEMRYLSSEIRESSALSLSRSYSPPVPLRRAAPEALHHRQSVPDLSTRQPGLAPDQGRRTRSWMSNYYEGRRQFSTQEKTRRLRSLRAAAAASSSSPPPDGSEDGSCPSSPLIKRNEQHPLGMEELMSFLREGNSMRDL